MTPMWEVGQQVVCIDTWNDILQSHVLFLEKGAVYTIKAIYPGEHGLRLDLVECPYPILQWGWQARRFRPITKTDISALRALVRDVFDGKPVNLPQDTKEELVSITRANHVRLLATVIRFNRQLADRILKENHNDYK